MKISLIVAMARNRVIGRDNGLPWHLSEDLRHFKRTTMGRPMIMGRRTFDSIGKALPGRTSIVLSSRATLELPEGVLHARDPMSALALAAEIVVRDAVEECMVIGGAEIYRLFLPQADRIYLTLLDRDYVGDAEFPAIDPAAWRQAEREDAVSAADPSLHFSMIRLERER